MNYFVQSINCDFKNDGVICGMTFAQSHELMAHKLSHKKSGRLFQCGNINLTKNVRNERNCQEPVIQKLPEKITEKISADNSNMVSKFDVITGKATDQDTVTQKLSNSATTQIETMDGINHNYQDSVILKLPETITSDVEKIADDTLNMANKFDVNSVCTEKQDAVLHSPAPSTSAKAATEVSL